MDERHTIACARYIERNPVRAKMANKPYFWEWSSAKIHCGINRCDELGVNRLFDYIDEEQKEWKEFIATSDNPNEITQIREKTRKGRPLGANDFVGEIERKLERSLRLKPKGRPKKK